MDNISYTQLSIFDIIEKSNSAILNHEAQIKRIENKPIKDCELPKGVIYRLSDICKIITGKNIDKKKQIQKGTPYITGASNITKGVVTTSSFVNIRMLRNPSIALKGDIIVSCVGTIGKIGVLELEKAVLSGHVFALRPKYKIDTLYLLAIITATLSENLPQIDAEATGFSNKYDPKELSDVEIFVAEDDEQRWLVMSLVRYAIIQVARNLEHISSKEVAQSINLLDELSQSARKSLRTSKNSIDKLFEELQKGVIPYDDGDPENPFLLLENEKHRINNLIKIL